MEKIINKLASKHAITLSGKGALLILDMPGFDQLRIERLPNGCISVAHVFQAPGFLIPEPDVCFFIDGEGKWVPINITQSIGGFRAYAHLSEDGSVIERYNRQYQADLANFCEQWAKNLRSQGWLQNAVKRQLSGTHLFDLGQVVATPGALAALESASQTAEELISRHVSGDWGMLPPEDVQANEDALTSGGRLLSAYLLNDQTKIWIISEWDRSVTTLLLPSEY